MNNYPVLVAMSIIDTPEGPPPRAMAFDILWLRIGFLLKGFIELSQA